MGIPDARPHLAAEAVVAGLVLTAAIPLGRLVKGGGLAGVVIIAIALSLAISTAARRLHLPPIMSLAISVLAMVWLIAVVVAPHALWGGVFPGPDALFEIGRALRAGATTIVQDIAPIALRRDLLPFFIAGIWMTTWLVEAAMLWVGSPLLAIAGTMPLFVVPGAIVQAPNRVVSIAPYLCAVMGVLLFSERGRARRSTPLAMKATRIGWSAGASVKMIGIAVVLVLVAAPIMPGFGDVPGFAGSTGVAGGAGLRIDPLVSIKPTLSERDPITVFYVRTSRPVYMRLTALEQFDGKSWTPGPTGVEAVENESIEPSSESSGPTRRQTQEVRMAALQGDWVPAAFDPVAVSVSQAVVVERPTTALLSYGGLPRGSVYSVTSNIPDPSFKDVAVPMRFDAPELRRVLALPRNTPAVIGRIARQVTAKETTPFAKAVALQEYLRTFTYDLDVAAGNSFSTIEEFLTDVKRGYCEQFATAMAVMARTLGIPSRVAIGFGIGTALDDDVYEVSTEEAHAWVELYFPGFGWLQFEPTPRSIVAAPEPYTRPPADPSQPVPSVSPAPSGSASAQASPSPTTSPGSSVDPSGGAFRPRLLLWVLLALTFPAVLFVAVGGATRAATRFKTRNFSPGVRRYADLLAWCASAGWVRSDAETPSEFSARLGAAVPDVADPAISLAERLEEVVWGGSDQSSSDLPIEQVRAALRATLSPGRRALVALGWHRWRPALGQQPGSKLELTLDRKVSL